MLDVKIVTKNGLVVHHLSGTLDETVSLRSILGPLEGDVVFNCREIRRINSIGIRSWIDYFQKMEASGVSVTLEECSPAVVECLNMIKGFNAKAAVSSIVLPYRCTRCEREQTQIMSIQALRDVGFQPPEVRCGNCGAQSVFDDIEEYFHFLKG